MTPDQVPSLEAAAQVVKGFLLAEAAQISLMSAVETDPRTVRDLAVISVYLDARLAAADRALPHYIVRQDDES